MPDFEYLAKLTQDDGATLLLRLSPNAYSQYSIDGTIWYDLSTIVTSGSTEPVLVDGTTIKWVQGRLTATQELPAGGSAGQVLTQTGGGEPVWSSLAVIGYGAGLSYNSSTNTLAIAVDNSSILISSGVLVAASQIPVNGTTGNVLTKTSGGYAWAPPVQYTFSSGLSNSSNTISVDVDNDTVVLNSSGQLVAQRSLPVGGTSGQVLKKTSTGYSWDNQAAYTFTSGLSANGDTVVANIDGATIRLNGGGTLYAPSEIPNGGAIGNALLRASGSTVMWGDPTSTLSFTNGVTRVGNTVSAVVDGDTIAVNSSGQLSAVNVLPAIGSTGQVLTRDSNGKPQWATPASTIQFTGGLAVSGNAVSVYLDGETVTLDSSGRVTATNQLPSDGYSGQVLAKTVDGVAWVDPESNLVFSGGVTQVANEVSANVDNITITINSSGELEVIPELPQAGFVGQVLTLKSGAVAWEDAPVGPTYMFTGGLSNNSGTITAAVDSTTVVISSGKIAAAPQIPLTGEVGDVLTKTNGGYAWLPPQGGGSGGGGASYLFTGGISETGGVVSAKIDGETVVLNSLGELKAPNQLPSGGTPGDVLTITESGVSWMPSTGGSATPSTADIRFYPVRTMSVTLQRGAVPLYLLNSGGKAYTIETGSLHFDSATREATLDTEIYRAYENVGSETEYTWTLVYINGETSITNACSTGATVTVYASVEYPCVWDTTTVESGGRFYVMSGGVANATLVKSAGSMIVTPGGIANYTVVSKNSSNDTTVGGRLYVSSGGLVNNTTITLFGRAYISSGGVASYTILERSGEIYVRSKGTAKGVTAKVGGYMYVDSGGTSTDIIISSGGHVTVTDGGFISCVEVQGSGRLTVYSGGTALSVIPLAGAIVQSEGYIDYNPCGVSPTPPSSSGGSVTPPSSSGGSTCYSSGVHVVDYASIQYPCVWESTYIDEAASTFVSSGGIANSTFVAGTLYVLFGGTVNETECEGSMSVEGIAAVANSTTVNNGGELYVSDGGIASSTTVSSGYITVRSGGMANSTIVNGEGSMYASNGGGSMYVSSGGEANWTTLNAVGSLVVSSGGTANYTTVNFGCWLYVSNGGEAIGTTVNSYGHLKISSGGWAGETTLHSGSMTVTDGAAAGGTTVNSGGSMLVFGTAVRTTINSGGSMRVDGTANSTTVSYGGSVTLHRSGFITALEVIGNGSYSYPDSASVVISGSASDVTISSQGVIRVAEYGAINELTCNSGAVLVSSRGLVTSASILAGQLDVSTSATVSNVSITSGAVNLFGGASANSITVNPGAYLDIYQEDNVATNIIENGGAVLVSGGSSNYLTFIPNIVEGAWAPDNGTITVHSGTTINSAHFYNEGKILIYEGGVVSSATGTQATVYSQGLLLNASCRFVTISGGTASSLYTEGSLASAGSVTIMSGGTASNVTAGRYCTADVSAGGTAVDATVRGSMTISSGGTANAATVDGGWIYINNGGMASEVSVNSGYMYVYGGGTANAATVNSGGTLRVYGGTANDTTVNNLGSMVVHSGGTANSTTVNSGGSMAVHSGGTALNVVSATGASITVDSGGYISYQ